MMRGARVRKQGSSMYRVVGRGSGFSLAELAIVVVIISIIGAIAAPKMSRGSAGAGDGVLIQNLSILRTAIELYADEHRGAYPDQDSIRSQLTKYTDESGNVSSQPVAPYIYGPYLTAIPVLPVVPGGRQIGNPGGFGVVSWAYDETTGTVHANTTLKDARGVSYSSY